MHLDDKIDKLNDELRRHNTNCAGFQESLAQVRNNLIKELSEKTDREMSILMGKLKNAKSLPEGNAIYAQAEALSQKTEKEHKDIIERRMMQYQEENKHLEEEGHRLRAARDNLQSLHQFLTPPSRSVIIHSPEQRKMAVDKIESYLVERSKQDGSKIILINPLEALTKCAEALKDFCSQHKLTPQLEPKLEELVIQSGNYSIKVYNNCIKEPENLEDKDREQVFKVMVDLMMSYSKGDDIAHHVTIENPESKAIFKSILAEKLIQLGLNHTIDDQKPQDVLKQSLSKAALDKEEANVESQNRSGLKI